jgi:hypothetical protein
MFFNSIRLRVYCLFLFCSHDRFLEYKWWRRFGSKFRGEVTEVNPNLGIRMDTVSSFRFFLISYFSFPHFVLSVFVTFLKCGCPDLFFSFNVFPFVLS